MHEIFMLVSLCMCIHTRHMRKRGVRARKFIYNFLTDILFLLFVVGYFYFNSVQFNAVHTSTSYSVLSVQCVKWLESNVDMSGTVQKQHWSPQE